MPAWRRRPAASFSSGVGPRVAQSSRPDTATAVRRQADVSLFRLKKENRLQDARAYARVFQKATRSRDKWFTVLCRENNRDIARLGLAIARKHCRQSTGRNRIKRIVRESFRQHQSRLAGLDVVVINQPATAAAGNAQLFASLAGHWQRCRPGRPAGTARE